MEATNPATGATTTVDTFSFLPETLTIQVGLRPLTGTILGQGSPSGAGFTLAGSGLPSQWVASAESLSNTAMMRGAGPVMGSLSGSSTFGTTIANYNLKYGAMLGSLAFDDDTNNDGLVDSSGMLASYWNFDSASTSFAGKFDLYSVALHEMLHVLGVGTAETWDDLVSGSNWLGVNVIAANGGSGLGLISPGHFASGVLSTRLSDGLSQEVVMDPSISSGTRKSLTTLDAAMLQDIGYLIVPEPSSGVLLVIASLTFALRRKCTTSV